MVQTMAFNILQPCLYDDNLAAKVNLKNYDQVEDFYEDVKDRVIKELQNLSYELLLKIGINITS